METFTRREKERKEQPKAQGGEESPGLKEGPYKTLSVM